MPKTPKKTDAEIRTAILSYREQYSEWPTYKQTRDVLGGPASNDRLARIFPEAKKEVEQSSGSATAPGLEAAIVTVIHAELDVTEEPLLALQDIRRRVIEALDTAERQRLEREVGRRRALQEALRSVGGLLGSVGEQVDAAAVCARGARPAFRPNFPGARSDV
ncbi:hypothetical protein [Roseivivax sp. THAF30]|uniref:hypothetical protein n=1 Tax=Roseivivax sp. THAF30 TaxID=2587852 RepID=UPI0012684E9E|nr:hypothetical protein [Roseivivax sp. THAF30]QFT61962.1 hypothetical protein FIU91_03390 [Roseivivax sp. THAF30]